MDKLNKLAILRDVPADIPQPLQRLRLPAVWALVGAGLLVCLVSFVDYTTPPAVELAYYYAIPVIAATWFVGLRAGLFFVGLTLAMWTTAEILEHAYTGHVSLLFVNIVTRAAALVVFVLLLSTFKDLSTRLGALVEERTHQLRQMATRLAAAEDFERRRLATDLHDGLGQMLLVLKLNLSAALAEAPDQSPGSGRLRQALETVDDLVQKSRSLTFDLHPVMLDHLGLVATLRQYGEDFGHQAKVDILIDEQGTPRPLDVIVSRHLFRSIKELMTNAVRHGQARQIVISLHWMPDKLRLMVDDDGLGFDPTKALAPSSSKGLGLPSIHERLRSLGGSMDIESSSRAGTRVVLELPLTTKEHIIS
jgi:signal transduction histidine kinase